MLFDDDGAYPADDYEYYGASHHHSFERIRVTAVADPSVSRTFATCRGAPSRWLVEAFLLSTGQPGHADEHEDPTLTNGYLFDTVESCRIEAGEPQVQILDEDAVEKSSRRWPSAIAPLRREHVQQELTRRFGVVRQEYDTSGRLELSQEIGSPQVEALLMALPPARRLALRAYLVDAGLLGPHVLDPEVAAELLTPMQWLIDRIGSDGVEQTPQGELPAWLADEAAAAMNWTSAPHSPPSPGQALVDLARASRFVRRFRGRFVPTARTRSMAHEPLRSLGELKNPALPHEYSYYESSPHHGRTLARLAIADGSATDTANLIEQVAEGLGVLLSDDDCTDETADGAVSTVMAELAPLGGPEQFGILTPAIRAFTLARLFPMPSRYAW